MTESGKTATREAWQRLTRDQGLGRLLALRGFAVVTIISSVLALQPASVDAARPGSDPSSAAAVLGQRVAADASSLRGRTYVALGDSISEGKYAVMPDRIFPSIVAAQLGMRLDLIARSGARAAWGIPQLAAVEAAQPALVTVELGTNDAGFNTPLDAFAQQYETIVSAVAQPQTRVLCIGSWLPSDAIDGIIRSTCERHGGIFVSLGGFYAVDAFHAPHSAPVFLGSSDWFHPGDQGHAAIAAIVLASLPGYDGPDASSLGAGPARTLRAPS
jgi:lysophospholipase L1-like esterase